MITSLIWVVGEFYIQLWNPPLFKMWLASWLAVANPTKQMVKIEIFFSVLETQVDTSRVIIQMDGHLKTKKKQIPAVCIMTYDASSHVLNILKISRQNQVST